MRGRVYLKLGRVSNLPTVWTNVLAGVVLAGALPTAGRLAWLALALSLFYVGGMFLNDAFDREVDARERPERPIPSGLVSAREVCLVGFGLLGAGLALLAGFGSPAVLSGLALAAAIVYYDAHHKGSPLSPIVMGLCRVLVYVTAGLAVSGGLRGALAAGSAVLLAYLVGLTYVAKQETLTEVRNLWPLACLAAPFAYYGAMAPAGGAVALGLVLCLAAWVAWSVSLLVRRPPAIPRAVVSLIAGISLLDGLLVALHGAGALALAGVAGFGLTLLLQRYVRGT